MNSGKLRAVQMEHPTRTGSERNRKLPDQREEMKKKLEAETLPNDRLMPKKPIHPCSDSLSDLKFSKRLTEGIREGLDGPPASLRYEATFWPTSITARSPWNNTLEWLMKRYGETAKLPADRRHFHVLRHFIASHLLNADAELRFVQDWLGHANIQNTVIYTFLASAQREQKARKVFLKLPSLLSHPRQVRRHGGYVSDMGPSARKIQAQPANLFRLGALSLPTDDGRNVIHL